jgi:hypothetical protein
LRCGRKEQQSHPRGSLDYHLPGQDLASHQSSCTPQQHQNKPTDSQRITSSSSSSEEVNSSIIAGTIHVSVSTVVNEGGRRQRQRRRRRRPRRRWSAADVSVDGSGWQAGGLLPRCRWWRRGNRRRTMDDGWQKNVGGRQNYKLTKSWEH